MPLISLGEFKEMEALRIKKMMERELSWTGPIASSFEATRKESSRPCSFLLVLKEWREPSFEEFSTRTTWSLFNAFTSVLRDRATLQPAKYAVQTIRLNAMLEPTSTVIDKEVLAVTSA